MKEIEKVNGKIVISEKQFNRKLEKIVIKNNATSGKITLPKKLIDKKVIVVWSE